MSHGDEEVWKIVSGPYNYMLCMLVCLILMHIYWLLIMLSIFYDTIKAGLTKKKFMYTNNYDFNGKKNDDLKN